MLQELVVLTGWVVVAGLYNIKMAKWKTRPWKYPTHVFGVWSLVQPEIFSEYYFMNRTLFCTVVEWVLVFEKKKKDWGKREGGWVYEKVGVDLNRLNILLYILFIELVLF